MVLSPSVRAAMLANLRHEPIQFSKPGVQNLAYTLIAITATQYLAYTDQNTLSSLARTELEQFVGPEVMFHARRAHEEIRAGIKTDDNGTEYHLNFVSKYALSGDSPVQTLRDELGRIFDGATARDGVLVAAESIPSAGSTSESFSADVHRIIRKDRGGVESLSKRVRRAMPKLIELYDSPTISVQRKSQLLGHMIDAFPVSPGERDMPLADMMMRGYYEFPEHRAAIARILVRHIEYFTDPDPQYVSRMIEVAAANDSKLRLELVSYLAERLGVNAEDPASLRNLAKRYLKGNGPSNEIEALWRLTITSDAMGRQSLWDEIVSAAQMSPGRLAPTWREPRWRSPSRGQLQRELPTLNEALQNPAKLKVLLSALAALRAAVPYYLANESELAPLEWGREHGYVFKLGELKIFPVSESFRRFIITNADGSFSVEMKIPGNIKNRSGISPAHFTVSEWLETHGGGAVRAIHDSYYRGRLMLYGKRRDFYKHPLGIVVFEYQDGKRRTNAARYLARLAREKKKTFSDLLHEMDVAAAATAVRLHKGGWSGSKKETDMHPENIRVTPQGAVLASDFGVFERDFPSVEKRRLETNRIIQRWSVNRDPARFEKGDAWSPAVEQHWLWVMGVFRALREEIPKDRGAARRLLKRIGDELARKSRTDPTENAPRN